MARKNQKTKEEIPVDEILATALRIACRRGYPADSDPEYGSAVGYGVAEGLAKPPKARPGKPTPSLKTWCVLIALRRCREAARAMRHWQHADRLGAEIGPRHAKPVELPRPPVPLADFELLLFVARHGKEKTCRLLGIKNAQLRALLEGVEARLR